MRILVPLVVLAMAAGCVADETPEEVGSASTGDAIVTVPAPEEMATNVSNATAALVEHPFRYDGNIPAHVQACAFLPVAGNCQRLPPTADVSKMLYVPEIMGALASGTITATWTPTSAGNAQLALVAYSVSDDTWTSHGWATGASGVTLELENLEALAPESELRVGLRPVAHGQGAQGMAVSAGATATEQPFALEGVLVMQH